MHPARQLQNRSGERGIALVAAVLVVLLTTILAATFMSTTTGERSMSSNVQTAKGSLYAADAGIRTEQQILANIAQTKIDSAVTVWNNGGGVGPILTNPANLFPAGNIIRTGSNSTNPPFAALGTIAWQDSDLADTAQVYNYRFTIQSTGNIRSTGLRRVQSSGLMRVSAERGSFADYLMFTNQHTMSNGSAIWFTSSSSFDGRVHTNTEFRFAFQPNFQDQVTSHDQNAWFYNNGSNIERNANNNGTIDVPSFYGGFQRNQPTVPIPANSYNQQAASLGLGATSSALTNSQINTALGLGSGSSSPANGVYVPNSGSALTGGIYVQGNLDQCLMVADTVGNTQTYRMTQGGQVKTIIVNRSTNTTSVQVNSSTPTIYTGTPRGVVYTNGAINDLRGPDRSSGVVRPAVAENTQLLVAASGDIVIQRDITVDSYTNNNNVLGIFSSGGKVRIGTGAPADMNLDAYVMAMGTSGEFSVDNYDSGSPRGTFHLRGGMVAQYYGAFFTFNGDGSLRTGYGRDFHYDRRGLIPPYYPTTLRFNANTPVARTMAWKEI